MNTSKNFTEFEDSVCLEYENDAKELSGVVTSFLSSYAEKAENVSDTEWLGNSLKEKMPEVSGIEINSQCQEVVKGIEQFETDFADLNAACKRGTPKEEWFSDRVSRSSSATNINQFGEYLSEIDRTLAQNNQEMLDTIMTKSGQVSQNKNLDGFIFEQRHANSFNRNAALEGQDFRAKVLKPDGKGYGKNSVDIEIFDKETRKIIQRYQAKVSKTADAASNLLKHGNYNNQRYLVGKNQVNKVKESFPTKTVTDHLGGSGKVETKSDAISKAQVKREQARVQSGKGFKKDSWNSFKIKDIAKGVGKQAGIAALITAAISSGLYVISKKVKGEEIKKKEVLQTALTTGADAGVKVALTGALKVAVEKGIIKAIPKSTPVGALAGIACATVENVKTLWKYSKGETTGTEALDTMARSTLTMGSGLIAMGLLIPAEAPIAVAVVGGAVAYAIGEKVGDTIYQGLKKMAPLAKKAAVSTWNFVKNKVSGLANTMRNLVFT